MASSGTTSNTMRFTGAQLVVHLLERQGITMVSGIPGGSILPIYDALSQSTQIRHILARHEQGAGFIAQGMARTEGKPAVCMACSGPGATNLVTAIADARPGFDSAGLHHRPGTGLDDRYRRLPRKWTPTASLSPSPNITIWCATLPSCRR